ncbi:ATP-dependent zinc protease [Yimella sp. cx-51]|uniref:ATP-dependent zinc protease family protein n=1 Tax=Yimella sp. cx-51 TaxID=2770551 RepID=UPI00165DC561|nr:ATP-dependent zinc protease [Yimella sp. cx-51]MBC9955504.1 ATP-dependent zinc protease [Yimella sp. cx-51]QTH37910.1 ATP-dependent zinc protease [Yimella sp. cx-51]
MPARSESTLTVGWREWVSLPDLGVDWMKAKLDTGARTSSIHAYDVEKFERDGERWVRFDIRPWQKSTDDIVSAQLPVHDERDIRSSNGQLQRRLVVSTNLSIAGRRIPTEFTLTDRDEMGFRMLVGREALRQGFLVDSGASYCGGRPPLATRRRNRGRA